MSLSLIRATISFGLVAMVLHFLLAMKSRAARGVELGCLERVLVALAGADAQRGFDGNDEDLAVADAAGLRRGGDRLYHAFRHIVVDDHLELHFRRSEEHTSELQSLMRSSYAVFCL